MDRKCHHSYDHGELYICDGYPEETKKEIKKLQKKFQQQCQDGSVVFTCRYSDGKIVSKSWNEWLEEK